MIAAFFLFLNFVVTALAFSRAPPPAKKVIVTGAGGRTGKLIFEQLERHNKEFDPVGLVHTEKSAKRLIKNVKCGLEKLWVCDVTKLDPNEDYGLPKGLSEAEAMIICTSAVPKIKKRSLAKALVKIPVNVLSRKKAFQFRDLEFRYADGKHPEMVDFVGQIAQIDLAKRLGISHIVLISSMGVTDPNYFLNSIGKEKDGSGNGDILIWKKRAEEYLMESGLDYTIIHPGGLKNKSDVASEFVFGVDDNLKGDAKGTSISRMELANICVSSLTVGRGKKLSFDCITRETEEGKEVQPAANALSEFITKSKKYDYSFA